MVTYEEVKKEYVIQTIANGNTVLLCDFPTKRIMDCDDMTVGAIQGFMEKTETKFFKEVANE